MLKQADTAPVVTARVRLPQVKLAPWMLVALFSVAYFGRTLLRASGKPFWYDELCTYYVVKLPTFAQSIGAVMRGADFSPPFFHLIHRTFAPLFGYGHVGLRMPEILAFWLFSVCLFRFVARRAGLAAGWIAMVLPMLTGAYYYATEARPYALMLGFLGVALVCWQELQEHPGRWGWRVGFAVALTGVCFLHTFGMLLVVPFGVAELWYTFRNRDIRWREWIAMAVPPIVAAITFIPMLRAFRAVIGVTRFSQDFAPNAGTLYEFYRFVLEPCWLAVALIIAVNVMQRRAAPADLPVARTTERERIVMFGLLAVPALGLILSFALHAPVFFRYILGGTAGCVLILAFASVSGVRSRATSYVALLLALFIFAKLGQSARLKYKGVAEYMVEPAGSRYLFSRKAADPLDQYSELRANVSRNEPLAVRSVLDFLYLYHYAPEFRAQLYSVNLGVTDQPYALNKAVREACNVHCNRETITSEFLEQHHDFQVYGPATDLALLQDIFLKRKSAVVTSFRWVDNARFLAKVHIPAQ